jgi:hypothetical protein
MNPRHVLLLAVLASACCLAPSVHASGTGGNGHDGSAQGQAQGNLRASEAGNAATPGYGDSTLQPASGTTHGNATPATGNAGAGTSSCGDSSASVGPLIGDCSSRGADAGGAGDNGDSGLGWQSLLPGSIQ